jgi:hypothetical protein
MKSTVLWGLIALNVLLLVSFLCQITRPNAAIAQAARRPADYLMIPGEVTGGPSAVVYMIDTSNGLLGAMTYDDTRHQLQNMPPIDLNAIFNAGNEGGGRGGAKGRQ